MQMQLPASDVDQSAWRRVPLCRLALDVQLCGKDKPRSYTKKESHVPPSRLPDYRFDVEVGTAVRLKSKLQSRGPRFSPVGTASANGSDTLTDFDNGLNRPPLLAPAPSANAAALVGT
jgi:hypothetical protein